MFKYQFLIFRNHKKKHGNSYSPFLFIFFVTLSVITTSCFSVKYSMSGASISPELKTLSVQYFQDRSNSGQPSFSQQFTTALLDKCRSQTSLTIITDSGDASFEGEITGFESQPTTIQGNDQAAMYRLTVTIHVKYTNSADQKFNFDTSFSKFKEYQATKTLDQVSSTIFPQIIDELTEDIFNKAFANW
jgi:hypothetical protein